MSEPEIILSATYKIYKTFYKLDIDEFIAGVQNNEICLAITQRIGYYDAFDIPIKLEEPDEFNLRCFFNMIRSTDSFSTIVENGVAKVQVAIEVHSDWNLDERSGFTEEFVDSKRYRSTAHLCDDEDLEE